MTTPAERIVERIERLWNNGGDFDGDAIVWRLAEAVVELEKKVEILRKRPCRCSCDKCI